ncbi:hypothetical protein DRP07_00765 [Archaeoglobales archaeon]|nr:MAG: hypothetical protein DRP07_00765 [Archaeoglobales archaeon]
MAWLKIKESTYINLEHIDRIDYAVHEKEMIKLYFHRADIIVASKQLEITEKQADDLIFFLTSCYDLKDVYDLDKLVENMKNHDKAKEAQK